MRRALLAIALGLAAYAVASAPASALAQPTGLPTAPASEGAADLAQKRPYWSGGPTRWFVAGTVEGGLVYYRPQIAVGYGKPHWRWIGAESQTRFSLGSASEYLGLRGALPGFEARAGSRYTWAANQSYLARQDEYTDDALEVDDEPISRYGTGEAEAVGAIPLLGGSIQLLAATYYLFGIPDAFDVFEEQLHVVARGPWLWRARAGYVHGVFLDGLQVGISGEVVGDPARDNLVVRVGPQLGAALTHHLDANLSIMAVVASHDSLRLEGNDIGQVGFRYKWATGDPFPEFP